MASTAAAAFTGASSAAMGAASRITSITRELGRAPSRARRSAAPMPISISWKGKHGLAHAMRMYGRQACSAAGYLRMTAGSGSCPRVVSVMAAARISAARPGVGPRCSPSNRRPATSQRRLNVEEDAGARGGHVMDAPVPQERGSGRAEQTADGQRDPGGEAYVGKGGGWIC